MSRLLDGVLVVDVDGEASAELVSIDSPGTRPHRRRQPHVDDSPHENLSEGYEHGGDIG